MVSSGEHRPQGPCALASSVVVHAADNGAAQVVSTRQNRNGVNQINPPDRGGKLMRGNLLAKGVGVGDGLGLQGDDMQEPCPLDESALLASSSSSSCKSGNDTQPICTIWMFG